MSDTNTPQIITLDTLQKFKDEVLEAVGIKLGAKHSIIQLKNDLVTNVSNSAFFGEQHSAQKINNKNLKNVLVTGQGNIAANWNQTIVGTFNKPVSNALFVVGNGTSNITRNNVLEVYKDGKVSINGVTFNKINSDQLGIDGKLVYSEGGLLDGVNNWTGITQHLNNLSDNELITADIAKEFSRFISRLADFDSKDAENWRNNLIQGLDLDVADEESYTNFRNSYSRTDLDDKALSASDGQYLLSLINKNKDDAKVVELANQIATLRKQISYLISCLTVDKITNAAYKTDAEDLIEYYAVGIADYALDADTPFALVDTSSTKTTTKETHL